MPESDWVMATCYKRGSSSVSSGRWQSRRRAGRRTYAVLLEGLRVLAVREHGGRVGELSKTSDREVLLVAALADDLVLRL